MRDLDPSSTWFLGPTWVHIPNSILVGSAVFGGLINILSWQTDRQTVHGAPSVTIGCIYVVQRCGLIIQMPLFMVLLSQL